ncbi:hypothetical protein PGH07_07800 [Sulfurovum sp. zt1-1]|uniref:Multidrug transporter n=1 Tax=Sulfurovum zhangzhouensis TaxID=3019067 RepID=A0ABT7QZ26_9BACT|nr:hypothetical protein [Sulfurovum zhangzhouensis]MDM5272080.1 hypothetical protein [Sulfurovum zhangzhouensis]
MAKKEENVMIYHEKTGEERSVPKAHVSNYVGKGYTTTKPANTTTKES